MVVNPDFICLTVHGLIELADSIQQDLADQALALSSGLQCGTVAEVYESSLDPDLKIESIDRLQGVPDSPPAPFINHRCDGWHDVDAPRASSRAPLIVRWHDSTPRFAPYLLIATSRMLRGYGILQLVASPGVRVLANSSFSARQLEIRTAT